MLSFFQGKENKREEKENSFSQETKRVQAQFIREFTNSSFALHLAISNSRSLIDMKNEIIKNMFIHSKEINSAEKFKKPKSKFSFFARANSESQMLENYDEVLSD